MTSAELEELRRRVREKAAETAAATKAAKAARVRVATCVCVSLIEYEL